MRFCLGFFALFTLFLFSPILRAQEAVEDQEWKTMQSEKSAPQIQKKKKNRSDSPKITFDLEQNRVLPNVSFESNSENPTVASRQVLKVLAEELLKKSSLIIRIEGHTDSVGYDQENLELSQRRAEKGKEILIENGIPAERLQTVGTGDRRPVAKSNTLAGQQQNRRVEFYMIGMTPPSEPSAPSAPPPSPTPTVPPPAPVSPELPASPPAVVTPPAPPPVVTAPPVPSPTTTGQPSPLPVSPSPETSPTPLPPPPPASEQPVPPPLSPPSTPPRPVVP